MFLFIHHKNIRSKEFNSDFCVRKSRSKKLQKKKNVLRNENPTKRPKFPPILLINVDKLINFDVVETLISVVEQYMYIALADSFVEFLLSSLLSSILIILNLSNDWIPTSYEDFLHITKMNKLLQINIDYCSYELNR